MFIFLIFLFYTELQMINNVVIVSGGQQRDSAIHIHESILPQTSLPSRLPYNIEQSSLCYSVGPCWLSIISIAVCFQIVVASQAFLVYDDFDNFQKYSSGILDNPSAQICLILSFWLVRAYKLWVRRLHREQRCSIKSGCN